MKKINLLPALSLMAALLVTGCGGGKTSSVTSKKSSQGGTSQTSQTSKTSQASKASSQTSKASSSQTHVHSYQDATNGEDFTVRKCTGNDSYQLAQAFGSELLSTSAVSGMTDTYKWQKGGSKEWTFSNKKAVTGAILQIQAARTETNSHEDRTFLTNSANASTQDTFESNSANDGTPRLTISINGVAQPKTVLTTKTYGELFPTGKELTYFDLATLDLPAGEFKIKIDIHKDVGYRLGFAANSEIRLIVNQYEKNAGGAESVGFKTWIGEEMTPSAQNSGATGDKTYVTELGPQKGFKLGQNGSLTVNYTATAAEKVKFKVYATTKSTNAPKCGIYCQPNFDSNSGTDAPYQEKYTLTVKGTKVPNPTESYTDTDSTTTTVTTAKTLGMDQASLEGGTGGNNMAIPVWFVWNEINLSVGENQIVFTKPNGAGYSLTILGFALAK